MKRGDLIAQEKSAPFRAGDIGHRNVICIAADASLPEAATLMRENHIGDLVVVETANGFQKPVGMITDRDILIETLPQNVNPENLYVSDIMSRGVATAGENEDPFSVIKTMKDCGVVRLPVVDDQGALVGIITARSLVQLLSQGLCDLAMIARQQHENEEEKAARH